MLSWSKVGLKWLLLGSLFMWALLSLLLHIGAFWLERNPDTLGQWASKKLGAPVSIQRIETQWMGFGPFIQLHDVSIGHGEQSFYMANAALNITLRGLRVSAEQLTLKLLRTQAGQIQIEGLPQMSEADSNTFGLPFKQLHLRNTKLQWHDQQLGLTPIHFKHVDMLLSQNNDTLHIRGQLNSDVGQATLVADLIGKLNSTAWSGNSYLTLQTLALADTLASYLPEDYRLKTGYLDLEIWQQWQAAQPVHNQGEFSLRELFFADIKHWHGEFTLDAMSDHSWQLQLHNQRLNKTQKIHDIAAGYTRNAEQADTLQIATKSVDIALLHKLLSHIPNSKKLQNALNGLQPTGQLQQVRLDASLNEQPDWILNANLAQVSIQARQNILGITGLNGQLRAQAGRASLQLNGQNIRLDDQSLFRAPIPIKALQTTLYWQADAHNAWRLHSDSIQLSTPHLRSESRLRISQTAQQPLHIDLQIVVQDVQVSALTYYLPTHIMGEELVTWLDSAFSQGHLTQTQILLSGPVDTFPYHKTRNGSFEALSATRNTALHYQTGWPDLQAVDAQLHFHENSLDVELIKGRVYNTAITTAKAQIESLDPISPLQLKGQTDGALADLIKVLQEDALKDDFGEIAQSLAADGNATLYLNANVPLKSGVGDYVLDSKLHFHKAQLALPEWNLKLDNIQGILNINLDKLHAEGLQGQMLGSNVSIDVLPYSDHTLVHATGDFTQEAIAKQLPQIPLHAVSGKSTYQINVDIPHPESQQSKHQLYVHSDLLGTKIDLPAPLGKTADSTKLLYVNLPLEGDPNSSNHIRYSDQLDARFSQDWHSGNINYATGMAPFPSTDQSSYNLDAAFPELDIAAWQKALAPFTQGKHKQNIAWQAYLQADQLQYKSVLLEQAEAIFNSDGTQLDGHLSSEQMVGDLVYSITEEDLKLHLQHAYLTLPTASTNTIPNPDDAPNPRQLPAIALVCEDLQINQAKLGRLSFDSIKTPQGLETNNIRLVNDGLSLDAQAQWQPNTSAIHGEFSSTDFGQLLHDLGFARHMHDANTLIKFDLNWSGSPAQFNKATLAGNVDLDIQEGRLAEIEPGLMRILSLLSLDALTRRLRFDFTDMLYDGYAFDRMHGVFDIKAGSAYTQNFSVNAASADLEIGGRLGLVDKDFDQLIYATPKLDALLPIIGLAAGGPVGAAAAFVLQQILAKEVDEISRFEYSVTGSWDEPKIISLDNGGGLSSLVNGLGNEETQNKTQRQQDLLEPRERKNLLERIFNTESNAENEPTTMHDNLGD